MNIDKVIITGDFSRVNSGKLEQLSNIKWLFNILSNAIGSTVDIPVIMYPENSQCNDVLNIVSRIGIVGKESWVSRYNAEVISKYSYTELEKIFKNSLVICLESPSWFEKFIDDIGSIFIEVIFHPVRFMNDLFLGFSSKNEKISKAISKYKVSNYNIRNEAGFIKAYNQRLKNDQFWKERDDCLLITGQMDVDRSLISQYHVKTFFDYKDDFIRLASEYKSVYYKPHPYMANNSENRENLKNQLSFLDICFPEVNVTNQDFYWLLSQDRISKCVSISSGTGIESEYFGVCGEFLYEYPWDVLHKGTNKTGYYYAIDQEFLYPSFWADLLNDFSEVNKIEYEKSYIPNRLRKSLIQSWGFSLQDFGAKKRLLDVDLSNKNTADKNISDLMFEYKKTHKKKCALTVEFERFKNDKSQLKIMLKEILSDLNNVEYKSFLVAELFKVEYNENEGDDFTVQDVCKMLRFIGKFGSLNKFDIDMLLQEIGG